jgi:hypothetical protein
MRWAYLAVGVLLGGVLLGAARFAFVPLPEGVHHHANFAVFVDGARLDLSGDRYMEDVAACAADPDAVRPQDRAHLHNNDPDVVHVHHGGATWGHLFTNLGFSLGDGHLILGDGRRLFDGEEGRSLVFVVNGRQVLEFANRPIRSGDRALVSVGWETPEQVLTDQYSRVASNATEFNELSDPAGCAGAQHEWSFTDRLRHAFWGS